MSPFLINVLVCVIGLECDEQVAPSMAASAISVSVDMQLQALQVSRRLEGCYINADCGTASMSSYLL